MSRHLPDKNDNKLSNKSNHKSICKNWNVRVQHCKIAISEVSLSTNTLQVTSFLENAAKKIDTKQYKKNLEALIFQEGIYDCFS